MYTRRRYGFWMTFDWSKMPFIYGLIYSAVLTVVFEYLFHRQNFDISVNWQPISVLGIAVAFYLGFKNNASYDRTWEARKYGALLSTILGVLGQQYAVLCRVSRVMRLKES